MAGSNARVSMLHVHSHFAEAGSDVDFLYTVSNTGTIFEQE
jgi:hypothetical protein